MNKRLTIAIVLSLLISLLTGCFPTGEFEQESLTTVNSATDSTASGQSGFTIPNDLKNVKFNFEANGDYPSEVPTIKVKKQIFDIDEMKALFLDGKTIIDDYTDEYDPDFRRLTTAEGEMLVLEKGRVSYSVNHYKQDPQKNSVYNTQTSCAGDLQLFYIDYRHLDSELDGVSRAEALTQADELVKSLDIKYLREPIIYAFTAEDCNAIYNDRYEDWYFDETYEFYLVRYNAEYNGIPIAEETTPLYHNELTMHIPTSVDILIGKDGLIKFSCDNVFDGVEVVEQTQIKCGLESAVTKLYEHYAVKDSGLDYTLEFDKIELAYNTIESDFNMGEIVFKPLWQMSGTQYIITGHTNAGKLLDPETGLIYNNYP